MSKVTCIAYIISPIHAISVVCGILARHPAKDVRAVVLVHWPGADDNFVFELTVLTRILLSRFPFVERVIPLPQSTLTQILTSEKHSEFERHIKSSIGVEYADEIYYAHAVIGQLSQVLSTVYGRAHRICFGDSMGQVVDQKVHLGYLGISVNTNPEHSRFMRMATYWTNTVLFKIFRIDRPVSIPQFTPDAAALILPVDQTGKGLRHINISICPKDVVLDVFNACREACSDLAHYISGLLSMFSDMQKYLLLTENGAEGNFIDFDREVEMYCSVIREQCAPGSVIFLKSHPAETLPRNERIGEKLAGEYKIVELDSKFKRYPIELWKDLVLNSTIICMSYPVLSLKYLYDIDVVQPMDHAFIEKWFPEWTWRSYKNSLSLYMEPLKNLATWDGKSVLWSGNSKK